MKAIEISALANVICIIIIILKTLDKSEIVVYHSSKLFMSQSNINNILLLTFKFFYSLWSVDTESFFPTLTLLNFISPGFM